MHYGPGGRALLRACQCIVANVLASVCAHAASMHPMRATHCARRRDAGEEQGAHMSATDKMQQRVRACACAGLSAPAPPLAPQHAAALYGGVWPKRGTM